MAEDRTSTLYEIVRANAERDGAHRAVVAATSGATLSYAEFESLVKKLKAVLLTNGVQADTCVALAGPNGLAFLATFLAVTWSRAIAAPLNPAYKVEEFSFYLKDTEAKGVIVDSSYAADHPLREAARQLNIPMWEVREDGADVHLTKLEGHAETDAARGAEFDAIVPEKADRALFLHTSGTTSTPKGVPLTHGNITQSLGNIVATYELSPEDSSYIVMPLFHVHGLIGATLSTLRSGGSVIVPPRFSASVFWQHVTEYKATWYSAVPTIHQILLIRAEKEAPPPGALRFIRSCSSSLAPVTLEKLESTFGAPVLEAYGMTEASHQMSSNPLPKHGPRKPGTVGVPTNVEITIRSDAGQPVPDGEKGEICIRGPNATLGYHNNAKANEANWFSDGGWFRTGDQGIMEENYLRLTGRIKELINRGGEKISPIELDSVLLEHPNVGDGVAFAAPDEKYGEVVCVAAVPKEAGLTEESILEFLRPRIASFKLPSKIFIADSLPRTATGKIQRRHVATHFLGSQ